MGGKWKVFKQQYNQNKENKTLRVTLSDINGLWRQVGLLPFFSLFYPFFHIVPFLLFFSRSDLVSFHNINPHFSDKWYNWNKLNLVISIWLSRIPKPVRADIPSGKQAKLSTCSSVETIRLQQLKELHNYSSGNIFTPLPTRTEWRYWGDFLQYCLYSPVNAYAKRYIKPV